MLGASWGSRIMEEVLERRSRFYLQSSGKQIVSAKAHAYPSLRQKKAGNEAGVQLFSQ